MRPKTVRAPGGLSGFPSNMGYLNLLAAASAQKQVLQPEGTRATQSVTDITKGKMKLSQGIMF